MFLSSRSPLLIYFTALLLTACLNSNSALAEKSRHRKVSTQKTQVALPVGQPGCRAALLMDASTGDILFERNIHQSLPPASMVKLMVAYVVLDEIRSGRIKADDLVTVSAHASKIGGSQVYLKQGETFTVRQLLEAVMIQSANDGSSALAEHIGGSVPGFVDMMNRAAQTLGMKDSTFTSPHGLPPGKGQTPDLVSAHDFSLLSRALLRDFPEVLQITKQTQVGFRNDEFLMNNHNHLLRTFAGTDGLKTGYYREAGFCVAATASRNDQRMIAIVLGCEKRKERDEEAARLLSQGFSLYRTVQIAESGLAIQPAVQVIGGQKTEVTPVTASEFRASIRVGDEAKVITKSQACKELSAPVVPNSPCGFVSFILGEREIGRVGLIVQDAVPLAGRIQRVRNWMGI